MNIFILNIHYPSARLASPHHTCTHFTATETLIMDAPTEIPNPYKITWFEKGLIDLLVLLIAIKVGLNGICDIPLYDYVHSLLTDENNMFVVVLDTGVWRLSNVDALSFMTIFMELRKSIEILHTEWLSLLPSTRLLLEDPRKHPIAQRALNCVRRRTEYIELTRSTHFLQILGYSYFNESSNYIESLKSFWEAYITRVVKTNIYNFLESKSEGNTILSKSKFRIWQNNITPRHTEFIKKISELISKLEFIVCECVQRQKLRQNDKLPPSDPKFKPSKEFENQKLLVSQICESMQQYEKNENIKYRTTRNIRETNLNILKLTP